MTAVIIISPIQAIASTPSALECCCTGYILQSVLKATRSPCCSCQNCEHMGHPSAPHAQPVDSTRWSEAPQLSRLHCQCIVTWQASLTSYSATTGQCTTRPVCQRSFITAGDCCGMLSYGLKIDEAGDNHCSAAGYTASNTSGV
ncbi:hypothetical protein COO60DRAFT_864369 [Scenedesmus sp. NREL 46B-D3]|nr:hypothetical protein COO60DRAFT_864369 [Scenedesmus sp. NREL 46B-D3]